MKLLRKLYLKMQGIKVIHSLPGRLRLQVPGLSSVPAHYYFLEEEFVEAFNTLPGIEKIELNTVSGRALIIYDYQRFADQDVLGWIRRLWKVLALRLVELDPSRPADELLELMRREFQVQLEIVKNEFLE